LAENAIQCPKCGRRIECAPDAGPVECPQCGAVLRPADLASALGHSPQPLGKPTLAGSADDRAVTLPAATSDASTLTGPAAEPSVEEALRAAGAEGGRYVEQGIIGRGGMGEVALCVERNLRREVAMKRLLEEAAGDPGRRARFVEEAQVTGQLQHPNIVPVYELEKTAEGTIYFTMKPVRGRSLADILASLRPLPPGEGARRSPTPVGRRRAGEGAANAPPHSLSDLLAIFLKVCDGVAFAHSRGVVHRDLKPSNIMVGDYGEVLVMDWGLAKIVGREDIRAADLVTSDRAESTPELTLDGTAMGTPAYMPPEQATGELDKIDHRSDIYALGAILYELLTLEKPVEGETPLVVLANAAHGSIVPPEQRTPGRAIPRELSAIAMKCLHKLRSRRYQSVTDLQRDITLYLEGRSVTAAPDTFAQAAVKLVKRNKAVSVSVAAAAAIIIALTAVFVVRLQAALDRALRGEKAARANAGRAVAAEGKRRSTALEASEALAREATRAADEARFGVADVRAGLAVKVMPDGPWGPYAKGVVAFHRNDFEAARTHLPSKVFLARVLAKAGRLDEAEKLLAQADPTQDWRTLVAAGDTLFDVRRYERAEDAYDRALGLMEARPGISAKVLGDIRAKRGRALARATSRAFYASIRSKPLDQMARLLSAKLDEIYGSSARIPVTVEADGLLAVHMANHASVIRWLDPLEGLPVARLNLSNTAVSDLSPLRGLPLRALYCQGTRVSDLTPLKGMPLVEFFCSKTRVHDLAPLEGMPLRKLDCYETNVHDLAPLTGAPLTWLHCARTRVSDLRPLRGMPLRHLSLHYAPVSDLRPLKGMPLRWLHLMQCKFVSDLTPLAGMPLEYLNCQWTAVSDLTPLKGVPLKTLDIAGCPVRDLGPLHGAPLVELNCGLITTIEEITPLKGMPLRMLTLSGAPVKDLTPLRGSALKRLLPPQRKVLTPESLKVIEELEGRGCTIEWQR